MPSLLLAIVWKMLFLNELQQVEFELKETNIGVDEKLASSQKDSF